MRYLLALLLLPLAAAGAVMVGPNATGGAYSFGTTTFTSVTNVPDPLTNGTIVVTQSLSTPKITVGTGANTYTLGSSNGAPTLGMLLPAYWSGYVDRNTNQVQMTNNPGSTFNQAYAWLSTSNCYVGLTSVTRNLTNRVDFSATNILGPTSTNYWAAAANFGSTPDLVTTNFPGGTWVKLSAGTNTFTSSWFPTNTVWQMLTWGGPTNTTPGVTTVSNGAVTLVNSNSQTFIVSSPVGATNQYWLPISIGVPITRKIPVVTNTLNAAIIECYTNGVLMDIQ